ncbi:MAG: hypothetical protein K0S41_870 [Anaerocolumna sp.]|jgi:oxygen-independent coproporphyrinogen-3 oxidase|nr:hypothetical protein [Anaerocolumna sp.]
MIKIYLSNEEYHYDIHALVKAFYPEDQVKVIVQIPDDNTVSESDSDEESDMDMIFDISATTIKFNIIKNSECIYSENNNVDTKDKKLFKNNLKRLIYHCLSNFTGKELPWGTLTGVRPTKIAYEMLEQNKSVDEIKDFMKEQYLCSKDKIDLSLKVAEREITLLHEIDYKNGYSIYIGIPFCPSTCLYCSFTSYPLEQFGSYIDEYLQALFKEITFAGTCYQDKKLSTIYVGGGTPTTLSAKQLDQLLTHIRKTFDFTYVSEFTVEAGRPDSITMDKLKVLKNHGITRISINPQTMNQNTLDLIGRKHTVKQIIETYNMARELGHDNINMDVILGLTGENVDDVTYTLNEIGKLSPDSLTVHTLAIKRAARLNIQKDKYLNMAATDVSVMLKIASEYAKSADYLPYYLYRQKNMTDNLENVGYAKFGKEGLYNILIMEERQTILALGAGGLCKFVFHDENRIERVENVKSLKDYIERIDEMIERKRIFINNNY